MIKLTHVADLSVVAGGPIDAGETPAGACRVIPIPGGTVTGTGLKGQVMSGGADFRILRKDGVTEPEARYIIVTESGSKIYVENKGLRRGEPVDAALICFRATPRFETADEKYRRLTRHIFLCDGVRRPNRVELAFCQVM